MAGAKAILKLAAGFVELIWLFFMLNSILLGAALLLAGQSVSTTKVSVEPQVMMAPVATLEMSMSQATEIILIEEYAAPHWNLSISTTWDYYYDGLIKIQEVEPEHFYRITYDGGLMEVILVGSDN